jgi:hypothetical protein
MDACGVEKAFIFAPELNFQTRLLTDEHLDDIRTHNDYCADICSAAPERLLGFCSLNPAPELADGDLGRAVDLAVRNLSGGRRQESNLRLLGAHRGLDGLRSLRTALFPGGDELPRSRRGGRLRLGQPRQPRIVASGERA